MQAFPGTRFEDYLDTPREAIDWLTRIHHKVEKVKADKQAEANRRG